jgi:hypothetical protein
MPPYSCADKEPGKKEEDVKKMKTKTKKTLQKRK